MHKVETKNENERMSRHRVHIYIDTLMIRRFTQMQCDFCAIRAGCIATGTLPVKININLINGLSNDFLNVRAKFCLR